MSKVYVLFTRNYPKSDGNYTYLPGFEVHSKKPKTKGPRDKVAELDVDECVDTMRCTLSKDKDYVTCQLVRVSNIAGKAVETITESFLLEAE
jgi:hypothetical protein